MRIDYRLLLMVLLVAGLSKAVLAQVSARAPRAFISKTYIYLYHSRYQFGDNQQIRQELVDTNTILAIARGEGLTHSDLNTILVVLGTDTNGIELYELSKPDRVFKIMQDLLYDYAAQRESGHSREFLLAAIEGHKFLPVATNVELRAIVTNQPWLPVSRLKMKDSDAYIIHAGDVIDETSTTVYTNGEQQMIVTTNLAKTDLVMRNISYVLLDGGLGWDYSFCFFPDGQIFHSEVTKRDVMDVDPKYASLMKKIDGEVDSEIKAKGIHGLGTVHVFWDLKKKKLKEMGYEWRSPGELNRDIIYD